MINSISSNWTRSVERNELSNLLLRAIRAIIVVIIVLTSLIRFWNSVFKLNWIEFGRIWLNCIGWLKNKNCNLLLEQIQIKFLQCFWLSIINRLIQLNKVLFFQLNVIKLNLISSKSTTWIKCQIASYFLIQLHQILPLKLFVTKLADAIKVELAIASSWVELNGL